MLTVDVNGRSIIVPESFEDALRRYAAANFQQGACKKKDTGLMTQYRRDERQARIDLYDELAKMLAEPQEFKMPGFSGTPVLNNAAAAEYDDKLADGIAEAERVAVENGHACELYYDTRSAQFLTRLANDDALTPAEWHYIGMAFPQQVVNVQTYDAATGKFVKESGYGTVVPAQFYRK